MIRILPLALLALVSLSGSAHATVWWIISPNTLVCAPVSCFQNTNGAVGGEYLVETEGECGNCFLNATGIAHHGSELPVQNYPFAFGEVWANCTTYNPNLYSYVEERLAYYDYLDDFSELNIADGLEGDGMVTGSPWWSPINAPILLYKMFSESDCYEDNTRIIAPANRIC